MLHQVIVAKNLDEDIEKCPNDAETGTNSQDPDNRHGDEGSPTVFSTELNTLSLNSLLLISPLYEFPQQMSSLFLLFSEKSFVGENSLE